MGLPVKFDSVKKSDPEFHEVLSSLKELAFSPGALDAKTKFLIGGALHLCLDRQEQFKCALAQARAAGATEQEVKEVMRLTYFLKGMSTAHSMAEVAKANNNF